MRIVAIVQARVGSTRLPAKILLDLGGATALQRCVDRVRRFRGLDEVIVATTVRPEDDLVVALARRLGVRCTRGSADDVLARYVAAARAAAADVVVRCTSDCPLLDPDISTQVIDAFTSSPCDYAANTLERRLPRGLDTEVVALDALVRVLAADPIPAEREHVTLGVYRRPGFRLRSVVPRPDLELGHLRWTLDTLDDYRMLAALFDELGSTAATASVDDILAVLSRRPDLPALNANVPQK